MPVRVAPQSPRTSPFATLTEAATYSKLSVSTLRRCIADGQLRAHRPAGRILVEYRDIVALVTGDDEPPDPHHEEDESLC